MLLMPFEARNQSLMATFQFQDKKRMTAKGEIVQLNTICTIGLKDEQKAMSQGIAICDTRDLPCKETGMTRAFERAMHKLWPVATKHSASDPVHREMRRAGWQAFFANVYPETDWANARFNDEKAKDLRKAERRAAQRRRANREVVESQREIAARAADKEEQANTAMLLIESLLQRFVLDNSDKVQEWLRQAASEESQQHTSSRA